MQKFRTYLPTCFAGTALILSTVGIFGILSYTIGQRTREIGILMAGGTPRRYIVGTIMKDTLIVIAAGLIIGLFAAFGGVQLVESFPFQVAVWDILTFLSVAIFAGGVAILAAYFPTRKSERLEVMDALWS
jgi:ABC-type antimicrobial peptide transport system permease subunit